jgi:hypothetical protein
LELEMKTWLEALQDLGWKVVRYGDYFTDSDGRNPDRYVVMLDTDGKIRKNLESNLMEPFDG